MLENDELSSRYAFNNLPNIQKNISNEDEFTKWCTENKVEEDNKKIINQIFEQIIASYPSFKLPERSLFLRQSLYALITGKNLINHVATGAGKTYTLEFFRTLLNDTKKNETMTALKTAIEIIFTTHHKEMPKAKILPICYNTEPSNNFYVANAPYTNAVAEKLIFNRGVGTEISYTTQENDGENIELFLEKNVLKEDPKSTSNVEIKRDESDECLSSDSGSDIDSDKELSVRNDSRMVSCK